jgi:putative DNA primase/helicase
MSANPHHAPDPLKAAVEGEKAKLRPAAPAHAQILAKLLAEVGPVDFPLLAFPQVATLRAALAKAEPGSDDANHVEKELSKLKPNQRQYQVLAVQAVLELASEKNWGICKNLDFIYVYNGEFWAEIDREAFQKFLGEAAEKMGVPLFSARHYTFRDGLFQQFLAVAYLPAPAGDSGRVLVNLANGTFEVGKAQPRLRPFDPADFLTHQLPFEYNPQAEAPQFMAYLGRVLPDLASQQVLAEFLGYIFVKNGGRQLKEEKALILYGSGANGKSVFFEVVNALLGSANVSTYSLQSLTDTSGYYRAMIANKLVNYASEINGKLEAATFKQLVSGEPLEARLPYSRPFQLREYAKLIFNCNELPKDVEHTPAYFRRFLIIPFAVSIPPGEQDKELHLKIIDNELSGVFNWVLAGLARLLAQGRFSECEAARAALEQYRVESDSVQLFLLDHGYAPSTSGETPLKELYNEYRGYCADGGFKCCTVKTLAERLRNAGYETKRNKAGVAVFADKTGGF